MPFVRQSHTLGAHPYSVTGMCTQRNDTLFSSRKNKYSGSAELSLLPIILGAEIRVRHSSQRKALLGWDDGGSAGLVPFLPCPFVELRRLPLWNWLRFAQGLSGELPGAPNRGMAARPRLVFSRERACVILDREHSGACVSRHFSLVYRVSARDFYLKGPRQQLIHQRPPAPCRGTGWS